MRYFFVSFLVFIICQILNSQETIIVSGYVMSMHSNQPVAKAIVIVEGSQFQTHSASNGLFELHLDQVGEVILNISAVDFLTKRIPIFLENQRIDLGNVLLDRDIAFDKTDNLITLTDSDFSDEENTSMASGLLQATRDIFLSKAAFDFGQAFFRVRGYDSPKW